MRKSYLEGRCGRCGQRVTLERGARHHRRSDGQPCGPVETENPALASDVPVGEAWMIAKRHPTGNP